MEKIILQNGGKYCAELTKKCTHLISDISFLSILSISDVSFRRANIQLFFEKRRANPL